MQTTLLMKNLFHHTHSQEADGECINFTHLPHTPRDYIEISPSKQNKVMCVAAAGRSVKNMETEFITRCSFLLG